MPSEKIPLTQARVGSLPLPEAGQTEIYDTKLQGFGVRLGAGGARTFIFRKKINGRVRRISLGRYPGLNVEEARKLVSQKSGEIASGKDPANAKREARNEMTLGKLFDEYLGRHAIRRKRTWKSDEARYRLYLEPWKGRRLSSIKMADLHSLHSRVGKNKGPYAANRLLSLVSKLFNFAKMLGYEGGNPATGLEKFHETKRDRFLHPDELPRFFHAVAEELNTGVRDYVLLSLLTGARKANVLSMRWDELELERETWIIPAEKTKNKEALEVPLHRAAMELLLNRQAESDSEWVFPGPGRAGHLQDPKKGWKRILDRAGIKDLRLHDLRRTLGSWQAATGANLSVIGKSLGHRNVSTTAIYARLNIDPVRESMNTAINSMLAAGEEKESAQIVRLKDGSKIN